MSDWRFKRNGFKRTVPTWTFWPNRKITLSKVKSVKSGSLPGYIKMAEFACTLSYILSQIGKTILVGTGTNYGLWVGPQ